jgi:RNA polymerase sigma-70 factor (ECF subfamily)
MSVDAATLVLPMTGIPAELHFETAFLEHYEPVFRFAYRIVGSRDEAEDVTQETFLRLLRAWPDVAARAPLRPWLYRVAGRRAYNALRSSARRERRQRTVAQQEAHVVPEDSAAAALASAQRDAVRRALSALPERQARLLLLRYSGLTYAEVAAAIGVADSSIGTLLSRAEAAFERAFRALEAPAGAGPQEGQEPIPGHAREVSDALHS